RHSSASPASSLGGKNSTENTGRSPLIRWVTFTHWSVVAASDGPVRLRHRSLRRLAGPVTGRYARSRAPLHPIPAPPPPARGVVPVSRAGTVPHPSPGPPPDDGTGPADSELTAAVEAALTTYLRSRTADAGTIDPVFGEATEALAEIGRAHV